MSTSTLLDPTLGMEGREAENATVSTAEPATGETSESQPFCNAIVHRDSEKFQELNESPKNHTHHIRKQGDDLIIAFCEIDEIHGLPEHNLNPLGSRPSSASSLELRDPRVLTLSHYRGASFDVPWALCQKWTWMKEIVKLTYGSDEAAKRSIDEGTFTLRQAEGRSLFLPEHWNLSVKPWQRVDIRLNSQEDDPDLPFGYGNLYPPRYSMRERSIASPRTSGPFGVPLPPSITAAKEKTANTQATMESAMVPVMYRIDYHSKPVIPGVKETFLSSQTWDTPVVIQRSNLNGESEHVLEEIHHVTIQTSSGAWKKDDGNVSDSSLILGPDDTVKPKKLHIRSSLLLNALRSLVKYSSNDSEPLVDGMFSFPFKELYHHREELLEYQNGSSSARANHTLENNDKCDRHISVLVDYLDKEPTVQLQSVKNLWAQKAPTTTFAGLWLLLKPGSDVYITEYGQLNACVLDLVYGGLEYSSRTVTANDYKIHVWYLVFDGRVIKRKSKVISVPVFDGEREIMSLPIFPTYFQDQLDGGSLRRKLIERGEKVFCYAKGPTFLEYSGPGLKQGTKKYHRARVVVEHQSAPWTLREFSGGRDWVLSMTENFGQVPRNNYGPPGRPPPPPGNSSEYQGTGLAGPGSRARVPRCECFECKLVDSTKGASISLTFSNYDSLDPSQARGLSEHQALLCMSHMFGFILKDRTYDILDVNGLREPTLAENAIDELVMRPEKTKEMIKAIVKTYTDSDSQAELMGVDFIRGKGEGQIFLLHGPPGTGKTLTAESVAEYTKRPLLSITAADLGHEPIELERNLLRFFKNATAWDAIVLLDEADIYLARRSSKDLRRNGIVSIFLRALDYFEGIIFFTTNRVGHFDEAFMSRIHVAVGYEPLDDEAREQIWESFFRRLKENHRDGGPRIDYDYDAKQYVRKSEEVKSLQWNGREIRNAFQTAVALAIAASKTAKQKGRPEAECVPQLTEAHLSQVVQLSAAFKAYNKATHEDLTEADLAFRLGNRYDQTGRNEY